MKSKFIIMVGPDPNGMGGISNVVRTMQKSSFFSKFKIEYLPTVSDFCRNKLTFLLKSFVKFFFSCSLNCRGVYIHTASNRSFYRKCLFILVSCLYSKKVILHIHPSFFFLFITKFNKTQKVFFYFLLNKVATFIVLTHEMKRSLKTILPNKTIVVLRNPIDIEKMENKRGIIRENNRLLYLGWYVREKGIFDLVDAFNILIQEKNELFLDFYGTKEIKKLQSYVNLKGLSAKISVNGWIDDLEKIDAFYRSTMLILPSYSEGVPNVILEAMATHTPIVATSVGGLKEILSDGNNAMIAKAGDPKNLSRKILILFMNEGLRKQISFNAFQKVKKEFEVSLIKKKFNQILNETFACNQKS